MSDQQQPLVPGTLVVCKYRMPTVLQPWISDIPIGEIKEPGTLAPRIGILSEAEYCQKYNRVMVYYQKFGVTYSENPDNLIAITQEQAELPRREKIALFLGEEALQNYDDPLGRREREA